MKKLYIPILSITCCIHIIQSMELQQTSNKYYQKIELMKFTQQTISDLYYKPFLSQRQNIPRFINILVERWNIAQNKPFLLQQTIDTLSEKLYNHNLTENEIDELVKQGANVNYQHPQPNRYSPETIALPLYFAHNCTEQGVKNMQNLIRHGAQLHDIPSTIETPLEVAVQYNYSPMIQLLLPYERPLTSSRQLQERRIREFTIARSFKKKNFESIKTLLSLGLITADQGITEAIKHEISSPKIISYLLDNGANYYNNDSLGNITQNAFPKSPTHLQILCCLVDRGAFNEEALRQISELKNFMIDLEESLKKNSPLK
jgi:hypothetical protein